VEPEGTRRSGLAAELDRIEAAVDAGDADLRDLGFWRLVALIKRDDEAIERHADQVGRIDAKAFARAPLVRVPAWVGLVLMVLAVAAGTGAVIVALGADDRTTSGVALVVAAGLWSAGLHSLTHYLVGLAVGIRFTHLFGKVPPPPLPGLKTDYASYLRTSPVARAWMHASGAVATKVAPFLALAFAPGAGAPAWAIAALVGLGLFQLATDVLFSTKASDWMKVRRELGVARARRGG
jgi:hypothetical protein